MKQTGKLLKTLLLMVLIVLMTSVIPSTASASGDAMTLQQLYGTLESSTRGYEAIQARIRGNVLRMDVYVNFKGAYNAKLDGKTYAALAMQGFRLWEGTYAGTRFDFKPGMSFRVEIMIHAIYNGAGAVSGQNYFDFVCVNGNHSSYTFYGAGHYTRELLGTYAGAIPDRSYTNGTIIMYNGLKSRYTVNQYRKVSAHEFGHVLGLGDAYKRGIPSTAECPQGKYYLEGDIMNTHGVVTPNNIEMMLEAYRTGQYQAYVNSSIPEVKSSVIRSY